MIPWWPKAIKMSNIVEKLLKNGKTIGQAENATIAAILRLGTSDFQGSQGEALSSAHLFWICLKLNHITYRVVQRAV